MKMPLLSILALTLTVLISAQAEADDKDAQTNWNTLQAALESGHAIDLKTLIGQRVEFEGVVIDPFTDKEHWLRPNPLRAKVYRKGSKQDQWIDTGIVCHVTLRDEEIKPVAGWPAAQIQIRVLGIMLDADPKTKEVRVRSQKTIVTAAD
jgi:hypothetical protein